LDERPTFGSRTNPWHDEDILITVKTYPTPSTKDREVTCVAGVTSQRTWIRVFPVPFRLLPHAVRFRRYDIVRAPVCKAPDARVESHRIDPNGIVRVRQVDTSRQWSERNRLILPLRSPSLEALRDSQASSLGVIRVASLDGLILSPQSDQWEPDELVKLNQLRFDDPKLTLLHRPAHRIQYAFHCDGPDCTGHTMQVFDWEVVEAYLKYAQQYGPKAWESKFRHRFDTDMRSRDLHFFVGTLAKHPKTWTIIGLYYPPKVAADAQLRLF